MKKLITLILTLICVLLISTQDTINIKAQDEIDGLENNQEVEANASIITETLDFVNNPTKAIKTINEKKVKGAEDSTWNASKKILTLKSVNLESTAQNVILLPANSTISVEGYNVIIGANNVDSDCNIIKVSDSGDLNISKLNKNTSSSLSIYKSQSGTPVYNTKGISVNGNLNINDGCSIIMNTTNGCINCQGDLTIGNALVNLTNYDVNTECIYITGILKTTSEYLGVRFTQNIETEPNKPAVYANGYTPFKDTSIAEEHLGGSTYNDAINDLVFDENTFLSNGDRSKKAAYVYLFYEVKYTLNLKANNGVELYKDSTKLDESKWPYFFYKKGNDNVVYLNHTGQLYSSAPTSAVTIGKGIKISGDNISGVLGIDHYSESSTSNALVAEDKLEIVNRAAISIEGGYPSKDAGSKHNAVKANSIQLTSNSRLSAHVSGSIANSIQTKSIRLDNSNISAYYITENSTDGTAIMIDNPSSTTPIQIIGNSSIQLGGTVNNGTPETLYIKTNKTIEEYAGSFASKILQGGTFEDMLWKKTADGYHYEEKQASNDTILQMIILTKPSPSQSISRDMPYSNNAFHGNFVVKQASDLTARVGGSNFRLRPANFKIVNKTTSYELQMGNDFIPESSPSLAFTLNKSYLNSLEVGTYDLELSYPLGSKTFTYNIKLNVTKYQPTPDPGKKDESCEKVIGPTWHWNNSKGICEDVGVVGTSTR